MIKEENDIIWGLYVESMASYKDPSEGYDYYHLLNSFNDLYETIKDKKFIKRFGEEEINYIESTILGEISGIHQDAIEQYIEAVRKDRRKKDKVWYTGYSIATLEDKKGIEYNIEIDYIIKPASKSGEVFSSEGDWMEQVENWATSPDRKQTYALKIKRA